jgi:hypothetical protein
VKGRKEQQQRTETCKEEIAIIIKKIRKDALRKRSNEKEKHSGRIS